MGRLSARLIAGTLAASLGLTACGAPPRTFATPAGTGSAPAAAATSTALVDTRTRAEEVALDLLLADPSQIPPASPTAEQDLAAIGPAPDGVSFSLQQSGPQSGPTTAPVEAEWMGPSPGSGGLASGIGLGLGVGLGVAAGGYLVYAGLKGSHDVMWPDLNRNTARPTDFGMPYEDVFFDADLKRLKGWYIPAATPTDKVVIFQPGHGDNKSKYLGEFVPWLRTKYNVLTFDFRGCGESPRAPSSLGYYETREVLQAIHVARRLGNTSVGLMGISMGGASVLNAGAIDKSVKGVVSDAAFADWYHAFHQRIRNARYPLPGPVAVSIEQTLNIRLGVPGAGKKTSPLRQIAGWQGRPVFLIHGTADDQTTPDNAELLYAAAPAPRTLWMVPGAGHAKAHLVAGPEYEKRVMDFWEKTL